MHILLKNLLLESYINDNPKFKQWFKNSVVVDNNGNPLKVFHGTTSNKNFDIFNTTLRGAWFAVNPREASAYTVGYSKYGAYIKRPDYVKKHGRVLPVYINIQNPKIYTSEDLDDLIDHYRHAKDYKQHFKALIASAKQEGYDGLVFVSKNNIYVAFYSTQIKSIFNNGEFDPNNPDITK